MKIVASIKLWMSWYLLLCVYALMARAVQQYDPAHNNNAHKKKMPLECICSLQRIALSMMHYSSTNSVCWPPTLLGNIFPSVLYFLHSEKIATHKKQFSIVPSTKDYELKALSQARFLLSNYIARHQ